MKHPEHENAWKIAVVARVAVRAVMLVLALSAFVAIAEDRRDRFAEIVVPVTVTDSAGRALAGLDQGSFRVLADGRPRDLTAFAVSESMAAAVIFAPDVAKRWSSIRGEAVRHLQDSNPDEKTKLVLSRDEPASEDGDAREIRFAAPRGHLWIADELAGMISLGFDWMESLPPKEGRRRAIFVVLERTSDEFRFHRKSLLARAAQSDVQVYVLWRSQRHSEEYEDRYMWPLEDLVRRTGGRSAQFTNPERIPDILVQFAAALRRAYELRFPAPTPGAERGQHVISVDIEKPARGRISHRRRFAPKAE